MEYGAIGDGISRPLSSQFSNQVEIDKKYGKNAYSLVDELDYVGLREAIKTAKQQANAHPPEGAYGLWEVYVPAGVYCINRTINMSGIYGLKFSGAGREATRIQYKQPGDLFYFDDGGVFVDGNTLTATGIGDSATSVGEWTAVQSVLPGALVTDDESFSSGQSLAVNRDGGNTAGTGQFLGVFDNAVSTGIVEVSFRAKRNRAGWDSDDPADGVGNEYTGSASTFQVGESGDLNLTFPASTDIGFKLHSDNNLYVFHAGVATQVVSNIDALGFSNLGTWHGFKLVIDLDANTYDAYYSADGSDAGFVQVFDDATYSSANVGSIDAVTGRSAFYTVDRGPVWYDDIVVTEVPEPASMVMLSVGAGIAMARKKGR